MLIHTVNTLLHMLSESVQHRDKVDLHFDNFVLRQIEPLMSYEEGEMVCFKLT